MSRPESESGRRTAAVRSGRRSSPTARSTSLWPRASSRPCGRSSPHPQPLSHKQESGSVWLDHDVAGNQAVVVATLERLRPLVRGTVRLGIVLINEWRVSQVFDREGDRLVYVLRV